MPRWARMGRQQDTSAMMQREMWDVLHMLRLAQQKHKQREEAAQQAKAKAKLEAAQPHRQKRKTETRGLMAHMAAALGGAGK